MISIRQILLVKLVIFSTFLSGCIGKGEIPEDHQFTYEISDSIFCEKYRIHGYGVFGGDIYSDYITDSITFRYRVGEHDDYHNFKYELNGGDLKVMFYETESGSVSLEDSFAIDLTMLRLNPKSAIR